MNRRRVVLHSGDEVRSFVTTLEKGVTVTGTVLDAATGKPVVGATVGDFDCGPPMIGTNDPRTAQTDETGQFTIRGRDQLWFLQVTHPDYVTNSLTSKLFRKLAESVAPLADDLNPSGDGSVVELKRTVVVKGRVLLVTGEPAPNIAITARRRTVTTKDDGTFDLPCDGALSLPDSADSISEWLQENQWGFSRDGRVVRPTSMKGTPEAIEIVVPKPFHWRGIVVSEDGQPVTDFEIETGLMYSDDHKLSDWGKERRVHSDSGEFDLVFGFAASNDLGIRAKGFATWIGRIRIGEKSDPITIQLARGTTVSGQVRFPAEKFDATSRLVPVAKDEIVIGYVPPFGAEFVTLSAPVQSDGRFVITGARPGLHTLEIAADGMTPVHLDVEIGAKDLALEPISTVRSGRIVGQLVDDGTGKGIPFEDGELTIRQFPNYRRSFRTDETGKFTVDNVPAGAGIVAFQYSLGGCFVSSFSSTVETRPGGEASVIIKASAEKLSPLEIERNDGQNFTR